MVPEAAQEVRPPGPAAQGREGQAGAARALRRRPIRGLDTVGRPFKESLEKLRH